MDASVVVVIERGAFPGDRVRTPGTGQRMPVPGRVVGRRGRGSNPQERSRYRGSHLVGSSIDGARGHGAIGSASALQAAGWEFESPWLHWVTRSDLAASPRASNVRAAPLRGSKAGALSV